MPHFIGYVILGVFIGFLSGIFGIGGSSIGTPALKVLFPIPALIALASPLPVTIPTAVAGTLNYWRRGLVRTDIVLWVTVGGLPGVVLGALGTRIISGQWLMILTGLFVAVSGLQLVRKARKRDVEAGRRGAKETGVAESVPGRSGNASSKATIIIAGFAVGVFSGLLANGGGSLLIPAFILLLGLPPFEAASTSLVCVALWGIPGTLMHWWLGHIDWILALGLSIGVIPASYLGSRLALAVQEQRVGKAFGYFLTAFGVNFVLTQIGFNQIITGAVFLGAIAATIAYIVLGSLNRRAEKKI
jgi:hypothetical protein